ncbi:MAG: hypothetical protein ACUZ8H_12660 [Candidatus Anammoxibacter sp.]
MNNIFSILKKKESSPQTISYKSKKFRIQPSNYRTSFVRAKVVVSEYPDGSIHIFYKE